MANAWARYAAGQTVSWPLPVVSRYNAGIITVAQANAEAAVWQAANAPLTLAARNLIATGAATPQQAAVISAAQLAAVAPKPLAVQSAINAGTITAAAATQAAVAAATVVAQQAVDQWRYPPAGSFEKDTSVAENAASARDFGDLSAGRTAVKLIPAGGSSYKWVPVVVNDIWKAGGGKYATLADFNAYAASWTRFTNSQGSGFVFDTLVPLAVVGTLAVISGGMAFTAMTTGVVGTSVGAVSTGAATALPSIPVAAAVPGAATSGGSFVGTAGDLFGGVAATPGANSGLAALTTAQASTGVASLSANEILSLAGNPQAFAAYQSAGMIPSGITMGSTGSILTSAGTALSTPSSGGLLSALQNVPTSNPAGGSSGVLDTVTTVAGVASSVVGTVATIATTKAQLDAMKQTNGMPPVQTDTGALTSSTIPTDITKGLLAVLAVAGYLAFS